MELSGLEIKILKALDVKERSIEDIANELGLEYFQVLRTVGFLKLKGFADVREEEVTRVKLTDLGKKYLEIGLPEKRLLELLDQKKEINIEDLQQYFDKSEIQTAIGILKKKEAIKIEKGVIKLLKKVSIPEQELLEKIAKSDAKLEEIGDLLKRKKIVEVVKQKIFFAKLTEKGLKIKEQLKEENVIVKYDKRVFNERLWEKYPFKEYESDISVNPAKIGKKHPYLKFLDDIRRELISMGFQEMEGYSMIISHFWNFEALFVPQDHPSGEMSFTDIFVLEGELKDFDEKLYEGVKRQHIKVFGNWDEKLPKTPMLISHVTAISAKTLQKVKIPGKYFLIEKVFRHDTIDKTHFIEFSQLEGIVLDESLSFRDLLGILKELIINIVGAEDVKFYPAYFPFTEPSVEAYAKHPKLGWIEVGGAGIFREELLEPFGINVPVIAWGLGIDRLAMISLGIDDIRDLHSRNLYKLMK